MRERWISGLGVHGGYRCLIVVALAYTNFAQARAHYVSVNPDLTFTPAEVTIYQYDRIVFQNAGGLHNVIADDNRFKCSVNCNTNNAPSSQNWSASVQFTRLGSIGYYCEQHGDTQSGMRGLITVIDRIHVDGFDTDGLRYAPD